MRRFALVRSSLVRALIAATVGAGALLAVPAAASAAVSSVPATGPVVITAPAGIKTTITPGLKGYDTVGVETTQLACMSGQGYSFDMLDVSGDSWQNEYNSAAAAGMTIVLFQGVDKTTWGDPEAGKSRGTTIAGKAAIAHYPAGAQIFLDLENNLPAGDPKVTTAEMMTWIGNWANQIRAAGYAPGIYVGVPQLLTSRNLDSLSNIVFWRSASSSAPQVSRGYVIRQTSVAPLTNPTKVCGISSGIDIDVAGVDSKGTKLVGAAFPRKLTTPTAAGAFVPLTPARILDTRTGNGSSGAVTTGKPVNLKVTGRGGVPSSGVGAVVMNVTVTAPTATGYLTVYPTAPGAPPRVSSLNFSARQTIANLVTVQVGTAGQVTFYSGLGGSVQVIADVAGYYLSGTASRPGTFVPITPARLLDTRPNGVASVQTATVALARKAGIPAAGAFDSAVLNLAVVSPQSGGYLTAYAGGASRPTASNIDFAAGQTLANMVTVPVSSTGTISLFNGSAKTSNMLADVSGYYLSGTRVDTGAFNALTPTRILDTRHNTGNVGTPGKVAPASAISLLVRGAGGVPSGATAVVLNVTAVNQVYGGYITIFPSDRTQPATSNIDFVAHQTLANQVIVPIGADGRIVLLNQSGGSSDLLADVAGYFQG